MFAFERKRMTLINRGGHNLTYFFSLLIACGLKLHFSFAVLAKHEMDRRRKRDAGTHDKISVPVCSLGLHENANDPKVDHCNHPDTSVCTEPLPHSLPRCELESLNTLKV